MTCSKIIDHLYLGDQDDATNFDKEVSNGRIVVVLEHRPPHEPHKSFHLPLLTSSGHIHSQQLDQLACFIHSILQQNTDLLVHCAAGIERSPFAVVWYLHKFHDMTLDEAYDFVRRIRPQVEDRQLWLSID